MDPTLTLLAGMGAFVIIGIMFALLWSSSRHDADDPITQEIIVKVNTANVQVVHNSTQESED